MRTIASVAAMAALILLAGCSSYQSTHVIVDEYGVARGEKFDGVPIAVTVPDKIGFWETVSTYEVTEAVFDADGNFVENRKLGRVTRTSVSPTPVPLGPGEVFTLDAKRPASGTGNSKFVLSADKQYPTVVSNNVTGTTITAVGDAAVKLGDQFTPQSATPDSPITERLVEQTVHLIAYDPDTGQMIRLY